MLARADLWTGPDAAASSRQKAASRFRSRDLEDAILLVEIVLTRFVDPADLAKLLCVRIGQRDIDLEYEAKMMQPDITQAQRAKARNEAKASEWQLFSTASQSVAALESHRVVFHDQRNILEARILKLPPP